MKTFLTIAYIRNEKSHAQNQMVIPSKALQGRQAKSTGTLASINGCAMLFHKTCVHPRNTNRMHNALHCWRLLKNNVFRTRIGALQMRSKIIPLTTLNVGTGRIQTQESIIKNSALKIKGITHSTTLKCPLFRSN